MTKELAEKSMSIILHSGDAREKCMEALDAVADDDFEKAKKLMDEAQNEIILAHKIHTELLQLSMTKEQEEYSVLFAHAQDTLMTVNSEMNIARKLIDIFEGKSKKASKGKEDKNV